ncbi:hypothetical protein [Bacillus infantis]|nr:hypothetical protein [Bacillus infantis]
MRKVTINLDMDDKITLKTKDFKGNEQELFYVLATSTRQIAKMIEDEKSK